jgi:hypothetical protein
MGTDRGGKNTDAGAWRATEKKEPLELMKQRPGERMRSVPRTSVRERSAREKRIQGSGARRKG